MKTFKSALLSDNVEGSIDFCHRNRFSYFGMGKEQPPNRFAHRLLHCTTSSPFPIFPVAPAALSSAHDVPPRSPDIPVLKYTAENVSRAQPSADQQIPSKSGGVAPNRVGQMVWKVKSFSLDPNSNALPLQPVKQEVVVTHQVFKVLPECQAVGLPTGKVRKYQKRTAGEKLQKKAKAQKTGWKVLARREPDGTWRGIRRMGSKTTLASRSRYSKPVGLPVITTKNGKDVSLRRSGRWSNLTEQTETEEKILHAIRNKKDDSRIGIGIFEDKGRGLLARQPFKAGEFVVEYAGDLIDHEEAKKRESYYGAFPEKFGPYMFYFRHGSKKLCIDATPTTRRKGRLPNHSITNAYLKPEVVQVDGKPCLILCALRDIPAGEELVYDYGERNPDICAAFPWLKA